MGDLIERCQQCGGDGHIVDSKGLRRCPNCLMGFYIKPLLQKIKELEQRLAELEAKTNG